MWLEEVFVKICKNQGYQLGFIKFIVNLLRFYQNFMVISMQRLFKTVFQFIFIEFVLNFLLIGDIFTTTQLSK